MNKSSCVYKNNALPKQTPLKQCGVNHVVSPKRPNSFYEERYANESEGVKHSGTSEAKRRYIVEIVITKYSLGTAQSKYALVDET